MWSDPALLSLWSRTVAVVPIGPLAWEPPYTAGSALKRQKYQKKKKKQIALYMSQLLCTGAWGCVCELLCLVTVILSCTHFSNVTNSDVDFTFFSFLKKYNTKHKKPQTS